jgi:hypothetical protein
MRLKLKTDLGHADDEFKLQYILTRTSAGPFNRLKARIGTTSPLSVHNTTDCLSLLNDWYGDRHRKARAWSEFNALEQGDNEPFSDFFARFEDCLSYVNVDDDYQIQHLLARVNYRYSYFLDDGTEYTNLHTLMRRGYKLDTSTAIRDFDDNDLGSEASHDSHESTALARRD